LFIEAIKFSAFDFHRFPNLHFADQQGVLAMESALAEEKKENGNLNEGKPKHVQTKRMRALSACIPYDSIWGGVWESNPCMAGSQPVVLNRFTNSASGY